jgi:hypothetical protein
VFIASKVFQLDAYFSLVIVMFYLMLEVPPVVEMLILVSWAATLSLLVGTKQAFGRTYCLHCQGCTSGHTALEPRRPPLTYVLAI